MSIYLVLFAATLMAQVDVPRPAPLEGELQQKYTDVADELRCPTCSGLNVLGSDAPFSNQIKNIVREQVVQGKSKDEILKYFTERYGPWILTAPPTQGFHVLAWALPISIMLIGPILMWLLVWQRQKPTETGGVRSAPEILAEMRQRLDSMRQ